MRVRVGDRVRVVWVWAWVLGCNLWTTGKGSLWLITVPIEVRVRVKG